MSYRMSFDRLSRWSIPGVLLVAVLVHGYLFRGDGGKMFAGMACCTMYATLALAALSIPRRVDMTFERLIICCLVEITIIDTEDIERAERLPRPPRWSFPVAGVWGGGGYYGYWFDLRRWRLFKLYTADWRGPCFRICRTYACDIIVAAPQEKQSPIKGGGEIQSGDTGEGCRGHPETATEQSVDSDGHSGVRSAPEVLEKLDPRS